MRKKKTTKFLGGIQTITWTQRRLNSGHSSAPDVLPRRLKSRSHLISCTPVDSTFMTPVITFSTDEPKDVGGVVDLEKEPWDDGYLQSVRIKEAARTPERAFHCRQDSLPRCIMKKRCRGVSGSKTGGTNINCPYICSSLHIYSSQTTSQFIHVDHQIYAVFRQTGHILFQLCISWIFPPTIFYSLGHFGCSLLEGMEFSFLSTSWCKRVNK